MAELNDHLIEYLYSFEAPADVDFFTDKQKQKLAGEDLKLHKTEEYLKAVGTNPQLGGQLEKDVAFGNIYSQGEIHRVENRQKALNGYGQRIFPSISIVSPTGQKVIMSQYCSDELGFLTDGYILKDELPEVVLILKSEGVMEADLAKLRTAMNEHQAIIMQNGAMAALFDLLQECVNYNITKARPRFRIQDPEVHTDQHGVSLEELKKIAQAEAPAPVQSDRFAEELRLELNEKELRQPTAEELTPLPPKPKFVPPPKVSVPMPPRPAPRVPEMIAPKPSKVIAGAGIAEIKTVDQLKTISVRQLRQGEVRKQIDLISSKIVSTSQSERRLPYYAVVAFEQSPLYKTYLSIGSMMILDPNPDRRAAFELAARKFASTGQLPLTLAEFEAIADLRKQIEQL